MKHILIILLLFNVELLKAQDDFIFNIDYETFVYVDKMPYYENDNGKQIDFCEFINNNTTSCTVSTKKKGFKIFIKLLINKEGGIEQYFINGLTCAFKNEIDYAINKMDLWNPGMLKDKKVNVILSYELTLSKGCCSP